MPAVEDTARRSVVPAAAGRSLWLSALWTGAGTALVASVVGVVAVSVLWLPAAGQAGNAGSAVRAGVLTFLAGLHGGVTVDGLDANFLPLGLLGIVALLARRAGIGLADAAAELEIDDPRPLWRALGLQAGAFAAVCGVLALLTPLGTSSVPVVGAVLAGLVLFGLVGGGFFVRETPVLADQVAEVVPQRFRRAGRVAVAVLAVQLAAGTLLAAASVVLHHDRVEALSRQLGGGWSGVPVLLLGVLAAPNAAVAGASYLSGAGFAVGDGTAVSLGLHAARHAAGVPHPGRRADRHRVVGGVGAGRAHAARPPVAALPRSSRAAAAGGRAGATSPSDWPRPPCSRPSSPGRPAAASAAAACTPSGPRRGSSGWRQRWAAARSRRSCWPCSGPGTGCASAPTPTRSSCRWPGSARRCPARSVPRCRRRQPRRGRWSV